MKAELVPLDGGPPIPIVRDVTVVGRRAFCDATIDHPSLSKRHAVIVRTDGLLMIRDLVSTNGTKVNGQKVAWAALLPNDRLTIGRVKFKVYLGPDDLPSPSEEARWKRPAATAASTRSPAPPANFGRPAPAPAFAPPGPSLEFPPPSLESALPTPGRTNPRPDDPDGPPPQFLFDDEDEEFIIDLD